jgi:branched-chain amino acid transport system permease protein
MYYFTLAVFVAGFLAVHRIVNSPFGQALKALRDNEPRATSLGYDTDRCKLYAFMLSAGIAGLAGSLNAVVLELQAALKRRTRIREQHEQHRPEILGSPGEQASSG